MRFQRVSKSRVSIGISRARTYSGGSAKTAIGFSSIRFNGSSGNKYSSGICPNQRLTFLMAKSASADACSGAESKRCRRSAFGIYISAVYLYYAKISAIWIISVAVSAIWIISVAVSANTGSTAIFSASVSAKRLQFSIP